MLSRASISNRLPLVTLALLSIVTIAAWVGVVIDARTMVAGDVAMSAAAMSSGMMSANAGPLGSVAGMLAFVAAWVVMMAAMMLPSAAPMILLYRTVAHSQAARGNLSVSTWIFVLGYLVVWALFGGVVYLAGALPGVAIESDARRAMLIPYGVALVLLAAGAYQFTALKLRCLRNCRSPLRFLIEHWRAGRVGAFRMGLEHGAYCSTCCWGLMAVLVAAGAMGLQWVLMIALLVAAEKLLPRGDRIAWIAGGLLLGLGVVIAIQPELARALHD